MTLRLTENNSQADYLLACLLQDKLGTVPE
jgi:hypothetical protein